MQHTHCVQIPLLSRGTQSTASQIKQSSKISYKKMNQWCTQDSDGCGQFIQEKKNRKHIAPLTPQ